MNRLQQDAAEVMAWHDSQPRRIGYGPRPPGPPLKTVRYEITEQERRQREQDVAADLLPF